MCGKQFGIIAFNGGGIDDQINNYETPVAVSGTHGKTTTTSMISQILLSAEADPTLSMTALP